MAQNKMYDQYYTASDVTVMFAYNNKQIMIDAAVGVGFRHEISSSPVYALGVRTPIFFSIGNSLGQGQLDLAFKNVEYLRTAINYITAPEFNVDVESLVTTTKKLTKGNKEVSPEEMENLQRAKATDGAQVSKSIMDIKPLIDIIIILNNANALKDDNTQNRYTLSGVKFTEEVLGANSGDDGVIHDTYRFMFKNIL